MPLFCLEAYITILKIMFIFAILIANYILGDNYMSKKTIFLSFLMSLFILATGFSTVSAENLKPFFLASAVSGNQAQVVSETKSKLTAAGFEIVGEHTPYAGATIIIVSNDALKANAKATEFGGYGAVQRVAVTDMSGTIQVSFTNPVYMANVYRMQGQLTDVEAALSGALGNKNAYGSKKGLKVKKLHKYHYMFGMPYFDDPDVLAKHGSYDEAIKAVEAGLAAGKGGTSKVYRVDIPGKKQSVFGVAMTEGMSSDVTIMTEVDFQDTRSTAHLPYELLVHEDGKVYALAGKFRIAASFPDLSMAGSHSFMGIMSSPAAIKKALSEASK